MTDIREISREEIINWCRKEDTPLYRADQIIKWLWKKGTVSFGEMSNLPLSLRTKLQQNFCIKDLEIYKLAKSKDGTIKAIFKTIDGVVFEGVLILGKGRRTVCVSTQAGCQLGCKFCATGQRGFQRDLKAWEIFRQYTFLNKKSVEKDGLSAGNIVFMGMGEPLLNYEESFIAIEYLTDPVYGYGISPGKITVSTAGIPEGIRRIADEKRKIHLAVSLHSANQAKREKLMPVAGKYPISALTEALKYYYAKLGKRITFEYILLKNINDDQPDMEELAEFCKSFPVKINIIRYNNIKNSEYKGSNMDTMKEWKSYFSSKNMVINIRESKGNDIAAACGQLAANDKNI